MTKECLWYNGELGCYELMDFDPNGLTKDELNRKIEEWFWCKSLMNAEEIKKAKETVYLLDVKHLEKVMQNESISKNNTETGAIPVP